MLEFVYYVTPDRYWPALYRFILKWDGTLRRLRCAFAGHSWRYTMTETPEDEGWYECSKCRKQISEEDFPWAE